MDNKLLFRIEGGRQICKQKQLLIKENAYLHFKDRGTGTPNLYYLYRVSKLVQIAKLIRQDD